MKKGPKHKLYRGEITKKIMAISMKIKVAKLWFLCTAPLNNVLYQCLKFPVDITYSIVLVTCNSPQCVLSVYKVPSSYLLGLDGKG